MINYTQLKVDEFSQTSVITNKFNIQTHQNGPERRMLLSGADFMKNRFNVDFLFSTNSYSKTLSTAAQLPFSNNGFMARLTNISIPQIKAKTFTIKEGCESIDKIGSKFEMSNKASVSIRMDEFLFCYDLFNFLGLNSDINDSFKLMKPMTIVNNLENNKGQRIDILVKHLNYFIENATDGDIVSNSESRFQNSVNIDNELLATSTLDSERAMTWYFEDVRFLGWNNGIKFSNSNSDAQILTLDFIFKRLVRLDKFLKADTLGKETISEIKDARVNSQLNSNLSKSFKNISSALVNDDFEGNANYNIYNSISSNQYKRYEWILDNIENSNDFAENLYPSIEKYLEYVDAPLSGTRITKEKNSRKEELKKMAEESAKQAVIKEQLQKELEEYNKEKEKANEEAKKNVEKMIADRTAKAEAEKEAAKEKEVKKEAEKKKKKTFDEKLADFSAKMHKVDNAIDKATKKSGKSYNKYNMLTLGDDIGTMIQNNIDKVSSLVSDFNNRTVLENGYYLYATSMDYIGVDPLSFEIMYEGTKEEIENLYNNKYDYN